MTARTLGPDGQPLKVTVAKEASYVDVDTHYEITTLGPLLGGPIFVPRTEWWGRVALWADVRLNHPFVMEQRWYSRFLPQAFYDVSWRFCRWVALWDQPMTPNDPRWIGSDS